MASRKQLIQYAVTGVVIVAVAALAYRSLAPQPEVQQGQPAPQGQTTAPAKTPPPPPEPQTPSNVQADKMLQLTGEAWRLAQDGKFDQANAKLDEADRIVKGTPDVARVRKDVARLQTPEGQLDFQLTRARFAVEHGDKAGAEKALAAVEKLKPDAPEIAELKATLEKNEKKDTHRDGRVTQHLTAMREALGKQDYATANSELNAAERIAIDDPDVQKARRDLNRARNAEGKEL